MISFDIGTKSDLLSIDLNKVKAKTSPSIFIQANDTLHKVKPDVLTDIP